MVHHPIQTQQTRDDGGVIKRDDLTREAGEQAYTQNVSCEPHKHPIHLGCLSISRSYWCAYCPKNRAVAAQGIPHLPLNALILHPLIYFTKWHVFCFLRQSGVHSMPGVPGCAAGWRTLRAGIPRQHAGRVGGSADARHRFDDYRSPDYAGHHRRFAALAGPNLGSWLSAITMTLTTRALATTLQITRMKAIAQNTRVRISYDTANDTYQVQEEVNPNQWANDGDANTLPVRIDLQAAPTTVTFDPLGRAEFNPDTQTATITLRNSQGKQKRISLNQTGRVQVQ